mgnify:CR=1 FL=1
MCDIITDMYSYYQDLVQKRHEIPFDIDGVVYKVNDILLQQRLGNTAQAPRHIIAYKFKAQEVKTVIKSITSL